MVCIGATSRRAMVPGRFQALADYYGVDPRYAEDCRFLGFRCRESRCRGVLSSHNAGNDPQDVYERERVAPRSRFTRI